MLRLAAVDVDSTVELADVQAARETITDVIRQTPVFSASRIGAAFGIKLWLKAELLQMTGSFKARGALNCLRRTPRHELAHGVITVSAGNHAQGVAWAAREAGVDCTVLMLANPSRSKVEATRGYGAEVVLPDRPDYDAFARLDELQRERPRFFVHPFDDPLVIAGQGSVGLEILEQVPDVDAILCPVGGGGLIAGIALAVKALKPSVRVYGVEPVGAAAMRASWDQQRAVRLERLETIADGLAAPMAGELTYSLTKRYVDDIVLVSDDEIVAAIRELLVSTKLFPEPAGAAATAALLAGKIPLRPGETVVSLVSGGNFDLDRLKSVL